MIKAKYVKYHDLIGFKASAKPNSGKKGNKFMDIGVIIDETTNLLFTKKECKVKKYVKKNYVFKFQLSNYNENRNDYYLKVQGNKIVGSPINRLRSLKKKKWYKK